MYRAFFAAMAVIAAASNLMADESVKKDRPAPVGTWIHTVEDGSWTLLVEQNRMVFKATGPGDRVSTLTVPHYAISEDGVMHGYVSAISWPEGNLKVVYPFAFRLKMAGETITISDLVMAGLDGKTHVAMTGEYKKEAPENAAKPDTGQLKR